MDTARLRDGRIVSDERRDEPDEPPPVSAIQTQPVTETVPR
jgi:hypothetical protein